MIEVFSATGPLNLKVRFGLWLMNIGHILAGSPTVKFDEKEMAKLIVNEMEKLGMKKKD